MDNSQVTEEGWHVDGCYEDKSFVCQKAQGKTTPYFFIFHTCLRVLLTVNLMLEGSPTILIILTLKRK